MGCVHSFPAKTGSRRPRTGLPRKRSGLASTSARQAAPAPPPNKKQGAAADAAVLSPADILDLCAAALKADARLEACGDVTAMALCALALCESSGDPHGRHKGGDVYGLWAVSPLGSA